jgi:hypothetical protein
MIALALLVSGCSGYIAGPEKPPPPSATNPPIYPGAQDIKEVQEPSGQPDPIRRITFETEGRPDQVLEYYERVFTEEGWLPNEWDSQPAETLSYVTTGTVPLYTFAVTAREALTGHTDVELYLFAGWPG